MSPSPTSIRRVSPAEISSAPLPVLLLDVRTPAEYEDTHIEGAVLHPLSDLDPATVKDLARDKAACVVVCRSGGRASQAAEKLEAAGFSNLQVLEGGVTAWERCGLPVVRGRKTISLERQVRIAAGAMVLAGALLAYLVHPNWIALPAFVGAGLMFAGITDWCGMALILGRMPWNR